MTACATVTFFKLSSQHNVALAARFLLFTLALEGVILEELYTCALEGISRALHGFVEDVGKAWLSMFVRIDT